MPIKFIPIGSRLTSPDRQPPYDETPEEWSLVDHLAGFGAVYGRRISRLTVVQDSRHSSGALASFGTHMHALAVDFDEYKIKRFLDEDRIKRLVEAFQEKTIDVNVSEPRTVLRNDGRVKRVKQTEPDYVNLTRIKRR